MKKTGNGSLERVHLALLGAVALIGLGTSGAAYTPDTDYALAPAAVRAGFMAVLPEARPLQFASGEGGLGIAHRHHAAPHAKPEAGLKLAASKMTIADQQCLAEALYYEARGEGVRGQLAVAEVVIRRTRTSGYPRSVCGVVYQGNPGGATNCQFSWACNGDMNRGREGGAWSRARRLATGIATGKVALGDTTSHALFFHATSVSPSWPGYVRTTQIGNHIFYRRNPNWHPSRSYRVRHEFTARPDNAPQGEYLTPIESSASLPATEPPPSVNIPLSTDVHAEQTPSASGDGA